MTSIKSLPFFISGNQNSEVKAIEIATGKTNQCFEVYCQGKKYFAKRFTQNKERKRAEIEATLAASSLDMAPKVLYHDQDWIVSSFIEHKSAREEVKIEAGLNLMASLHQIEIPLPAHNVSKVINNLCNTDYLSRHQLALMALIRDKLARFLIPGKLVPCHGDLNYSNLLFGIEKAYLVDFDCACLAELEFDIAMFIAVNHIDLAQMENILGKYQSFAGNSLAPNKEKVMRYLLYCYLINGLWYLLRGKLQSDDRLIQLAFKQFRRFDQLKFTSEKLDIEMR